MIQEYFPEINLQLQNNKTYPDMTPDIQSKERILVIRAKIIKSLI